jgi:hypothetical protein
MPSWTMAQDAVEVPATPEEIATASAYADQLIAKGGAAKYFENITKDASATVRHKASGMTCSFSNEQHDAIRIYPSGSSGIPEGEDVGCNTRLMETDLSIYATKYPQRAHAEDIMQSAVAAIVQRWPDAKVHEGELISVSVNDGPSPLVAAYDVKVSGQAMLTVAFVLHKDDWSFKGRATGPTADDAPVNLLAALTFTASLPGSRED